ncbi:nuclear transport factor 2 family protein [Chitinophaga tropicalis]|uniref:DUF4440 domain-containing protein n=1 Tax=Chitinophaga tropicalis TaxID=2683588 RepID=A0A7K1U1Q3_9BACT|nr:nuclear transport factor 2 family protein [Chitinophaga tropicalis]MVT08304.1 DUF4440 domain-containing protein [Chitinophaga tropicalis]
MKTYLTLIFLAICNFSFAQTDQELSATITRLDSLFWDSYNHCDTTKMGSFFTEDVEFYHDKGGVTLGLPALVHTFSKNICSNTGFRLRREPVEGTYKVFPMKKDGVIYGAILSGEHVFYILETGKPERLDGLAKFTHLWLLTDGVWKMKRVLSYDHGPAPYKNKRKEIALSDKALAKYAGKYKGTQIGNVEVQVEAHHLILKIGEKKFDIYPEKENLFFDKTRDLTFEFTQGEKLTVREFGAVAEELVAVK